MLKEKFMEIFTEEIYLLRTKKYQRKLVFMMYRPCNNTAVGLISMIAWQKS
jgi:hypothetical protein